MKITSSNLLDVDVGIAEQIRCELPSIIDRAYSPAGNPAVCLVYDSTNNRYKGISIQGAKEVVAPEFLPINTLESVRCYEIEPILNEGINYLVFVEPGSGFGGENFTQYLIAKEWFKDLKTGEMTLGYENTDNEDVGLTSETSITTYVV